MRNPNELINPAAVFLSIKEVGKLFSPPISRQKLAVLQRTGALRLVSYKIGERIFYKKQETIERIEELCVIHMKYDLDPFV